MSKEPTYKEKHGVTRVGKFLRDAASAGKEWAPTLLDVAGTITGREGLSSLADKIRGDQSINEQDKEIALKLIEKDIAEMQEDTKQRIAEYELQKAYDSSVTERWRSDSESDSWLSKNTRPLLVCFVVLFYSVVATLDSIETMKFNVPESHMNLLDLLVISSVTAYFGLRTMDKRFKFKYK